MRVLWQDDFAGPAGAPPDPASWTALTGGGGWGNNELQTYTDAPANAALDGDGHLVVTARRAADGSWTSARLVTAGRRSVRLGSIEVRAQLPAGTGIWPAAWAMGEDLDVVGWPRCGEVDLVESVGDATLALHTVHGPQGEDGHWQLGHVTPVPGSLADGFHDHAVHVAADRVTFSLDGEVTGVVLRDDVPAGGRWPFEQPLHLLLNVAVGGDLPGPPDGTTPAEARLVVDRVRFSV